MSRLLSAYQKKKKRVKYAHVSRTRTFTIIDGYIFYPRSFIVTTRTVDAMIYLRRSGRRFLSVFFFAVYKIEACFRIFCIRSIEVRSQFLSLHISSVPMMVRFTFLLKKKNLSGIEERAADEFNFVLLLLSMPIAHI